MELGIAGKVAAVAAASKGLGRACAEALAREGVDVAICARGGDALAEAARALGELGVRVHAIPLDLARDGAPEEFIEETARALGGPDIVVTNIGGPPSGTFDTFSDDDFRVTLERNLLVPIRLARAAVPHMKRAGWGRIVNIASLAAKEPIEGLMIGNTARAGVLGWAKSLARELAPHGITVNTIAPGIFLTDRMRELAGQRAERDGITLEQALEGMAVNPTMRVGRPDEFGALAAFLASDHAGYITGTTVVIDGGASRAIF